jgi:hypothetical protein
MQTLTASETVLFALTENQVMEVVLRDRREEFELELMPGKYRLNHHHTRREAGTQSLVRLVQYVHVVGFRQSQSE